MITYHTYNSTGLLSNYIKYFYFLEHKGDSKNASLQRVTPDGCVEINFNLAGRSLQSISIEGTERLQAESYIVNRASEHYFVKRKGNVKMVGVCFYPWGFHAFTKTPLFELKDKQVDAYGLFGRDVDYLYEHLCSLTSPAEMVSSLEAYLLKKVIEDKIDELVIESAAEIFNNPTVSISAMADKFSLSHRRMEQRFKNCLGISPKHFLRLTRFQRALSSLRKGNSLDVAFGHGYYDQAHFIKEFKYFSGLSPEKYLNENHSLNDLVTKWGKA